MKEYRRPIVKEVKDDKRAEAGKVLFLDLTYRPVPSGDEQDSLIPHELYRIREKFSVRLPIPSTPKEPKIRWREFLGGPYIFYLRDGTTIIGRLVQQYQSFIKLVDVTIIRNGVRTKTRWMLQDGGEVKSFIPADAVSERVG
jgi:hypothetical protein